MTGEKNTEKILQFINAASFPCLMAKAVAKAGRLKVMPVDEHVPMTDILTSIYRFVDQYRINPKKLSSFVIELNHRGLTDFEAAESFFWRFIKKLSECDRKWFKHDSRVSSDIWSNFFSYSLKEEAFFLLLLHPKSPRLSRRYSRPAIVFNLHSQFEVLRKNQKFSRIRDAIRKRDYALQGERNLMLADYGNASEIFQYTGRHYREGEDPRNYLKGEMNEDFGTQKRHSA